MPALRFGIAGGLTRPAVWTRSSPPDRRYRVDHHHKDDVRRLGSSEAGGRHPTQPN